MPQSGKKSSLNPISGKWRIIKLLLIVLLCSPGIASYAQFATATITETPESVGFTGGSHGSDILDYSSDTYDVSTYQNVFDAGLYWNVAGVATGMTSFTTQVNVSNSDVALMEVGGKVFAVTTYHVAGGTNAYYCEIFEWNGNNFAPYSLYSIVAGVFSNSLHIDAAHNNYTIVWDQNGDVNIVTGDITGLHNGGAPVVINYFFDSYPDVAMFYDGTTEWAHIVFLTVPSTYTWVAVEDCDLADLATGTFFPYNSWSTPTPNWSLSGNLSAPRIACPNSSNTVYDWTVVALESDINTGTPTFWNVLGWNSQNGPSPTITPYIYNLGNYSLGTDITFVPNEYPTVTYDDQYPTTDGIWVGWTMDNLLGIIGGTTDALYPIVVKCDKDAKPLGGNYWDVPMLLASGDLQTRLELSGRSTAGNILLTYWGYTVNSTPSVLDIYTKQAPSSSSTSLRIANNTGLELEETANHLYSDLNNYRLPVHLKLFDLNGRMVLEEKGTVENIRSALKLNRTHLPLSFYIAQVLSDDGVISFTQKISISK